MVYYLITNVYDHATVAASPQSINHTGTPEYEDIIINVKELFHFKSLKLEIYGLLTTPMLALKKCFWCEITLGWLHRQLHMNMNETACYNLRCSLKGKISACSPTECVVCCINHSAGWREHFYISNLPFFKGSSVYGKFYRVLSVVRQRKDAAWLKMTN